MTDNHDDLSSRLRHGLNRGAAPELSDDLVTGAAARPAPHLPNPARTLRAAGGATLAVAALAVAAVVVVPSLTPRSPLFTAAGAAPASALGTEDARSSDMKIGWWVDYNYTADPSLSTQPGRGQVYRLVLGTDDPARYTAELAEILGVDGDVSEADWSDDLYPTWVVGPQDGTGTSLSFSAYGTGDWWFNDPAATPIYVCDDTVTAEQSIEFGCVLPAEAPANLAPTGDEARALAQELFASTGYDVDAADIELYSDDWGTTATAYLVVEGARTAIAWSANWSNTGELSYASGHALSIESQGTFDTVSPADAVTRLEDGRWWGSPGPDFQGGMVAFASDTVGGETLRTDVVEPSTGEGEPGVEPGDPGVEPTEPAVDPTAPVEPAPVDPAPTEEPVDPSVPIDPMPEPLPTPEVVDVTIDNATPTLLLLWDVDGNAWLVPGYAMQMEEGWFNAVVSLIEGIIALPEPIMIEPAVLDPAVTEVVG